MPPCSQQGWQAQQQWQQQQRQQREQGRCWGLSLHSLSLCMPPQRQMGPNYCRVPPALLLLLLLPLLLLARSCLLARTHLLVLRLLAAAAAVVVLRWHWQHQLQRSTPLWRRWRCS